MLKKRTKVLSRNSVKGRKYPTRKKVHSKSRKIVKKEKNYSFSSAIFSSLIIFAGFISLSLTIFFLSGNYNQWSEMKDWNSYVLINLVIKKVKTIKNQNWNWKSLLEIVISIARIFFFQKKRPKKDLNYSQLWGIFFLDLFNISPSALGVLVREFESCRPY